MQKCIPGHHDLSCASVIQVLLLPGGCGNGTVGVHDDLGTADDHDYEEEAEENKASQGQPLVHIHIDWLGSGFLHPAAVTVGSQGSGLTGTIFYPCRERQLVRKSGLLVCVSYPQGQEHITEVTPLWGTHMVAALYLVGNLCSQQDVPRGCSGGVKVTLSRTWVEWAEGSAWGQYPVAVSTPKALQEVMRAMKAILSIQQRQWQSMIKTL